MLQLSAPPILKLLFHYCPSRCQKCGLCILLLLVNSLHNNVKIKFTYASERYSENIGPMIISAFNANLRICTLQFLNCIWIFVKPRFFDYRLLISSHSCNIREKMYFILSSAESGSVSLEKSSNPHCLFLSLMNSYMLA